jgi:hypothetical protein
VRISSANLVASEKMMSLLMGDSYLSFVR